MRGFEGNISFKAVKWLKSDNKPPFFYLFSLIVLVKIRSVTTTYSYLFKPCHYK